MGYPACSRNCQGASCWLTLGEKHYPPQFPAYQGAAARCKDENYNKVMSRGWSLRLYQNHLFLIFLSLVWSFSVSVQPLLRRRSGGYTPQISLPAERAPIITLLLWFQKLLNIWYPFWRKFVSACWNGVMTAGILKNLQKLLTDVYIVCIMK